jgi:hypothetical protein
MMTEFDLNPRELQAILTDSTTRFELWTELLRLCDVRVAAEVGVWKGDFAAQILRSCASITSYYMIDPWRHLPDWNKPWNVSQNAFDAIYDEAMSKTRFAAARITVLRGRTKDAADKIKDGSLDFAYIDGDHTLRGITIDLIKLLPKIKPGGLLGGDDFVDTPWQHDARFEPTLVFPFAVHFAEAMDLPIIALPFNQFLIHNERARGFSFTDTTGLYSDLSLNKLPRSRAEGILPILGRLFFRLRSR